MTNNTEPLHVSSLELSANAAVPKSSISSARAVTTTSCSSDDLGEVPRGLEKSLRPYGCLETTPLTLAQAVRRGSCEEVCYLLDQEKAALDWILPSKLARSPSTELFQVLIDHGWDINQMGPDRGAGPGECLLQLVCDNESLVKWCLDHGAKVKGLYADPYKSPPLLELVALHGTISTFKLLYSRGAELGPRTLHRAVQSACTTNNSMRLERLAMVEYLVDTLGLDVNALDCEGHLPDHQGTPLCYTSIYTGGGRDVVRFLLERGADPYIKDSSGVHDAYSLAERTQNQEVMQTIDEWVKQRQSK